MTEFTKVGYCIKAGKYTLKPHWNGTGDAAELQAIADRLLEAAAQQAAHQRLEKAVRELLGILPLEPYQLDAYVSCTFGPEAKSALKDLAIARNIVMNNP